LVRRAQFPTRHFDFEVIDGVAFELQTVDFPDAIDTRCDGISDPIEIAGRYTDGKRDGAWILCKMNLLQGLNIDLLLVGIASG
jgi:hypothetical protein